MYSRLHLAALGGLLLVALQMPRAESRSSALQVRVTVVRSCSFETRGAGRSATLALTCGGGTAGVVSTGSGAGARVIPVPARQTTVLSPRSSQNSTTRTALRADAPVRQVVTVNF
jgi:hypothetical protein